MKDREHSTDALLFLSTHGFHQLLQSVQHNFPSQNTHFTTKPMPLNQLKHYP